LVRLVFVRRKKMPTDKAVVEEHKENATVVFDESMKGKKIDAIDKHKVSLDFEDEGRKAVPRGRENLICAGQRIPSKRFKQRYDEIAWACSECGKMHPKGSECNVKSPDVGKT
jgi:hypothetical protein